MKNDLQNEINKNKILNEQIIQLKKDLNIEINNKNKLIDINEELKQQLKSFKNNSNTNKDIIIELYQKIDELKEKISRYPFELSKGEKLISVIFTSSDHKVHSSIICKNTEKFIKLEEKL